MAQDAARQLHAQGESANTVRSYQAALRYWSAWFHLRYGRAIEMPVTAATAVQFIVDHAQRMTPDGLRSAMPEEIDAALVAAGRKGKPGVPALTTLQHRLSVLSKAHRLAGQPNPVQSPEVRELMAKTRRAYAKLGVRKKKKPALTREPLQALIATCDDSLRGIRDRAVLLFAWSSGGRRRSEVASAVMENLKAIGADEYIYTLARSKTNQAGHDGGDADKPIVGEAGRALAAWLKAGGVTGGAIFRRVRGDRLLGALSDESVRGIVKRRAALAGLDAEFSAHSLRSGFVTEAARRRIPMAETMALTGHTSVATVIGYFRTEAAVTSKAARLLED